MKIVRSDKWLPCDGIILEEAADIISKVFDEFGLIEKE